MSTALSTVSTNDLLKKGSETKGFDPRKLSKNTIRLLLVGAVGLVVYWKLLPFLKDIVWGTVELIEGGIVGIIGGIILYALWKNIGNFAAWLSRTFLGWIIEHDPWVLQYKQIDQAEEDLEKMLAESAKIHGVYTDNVQGIETAQEAYDTAVEAESIVRQELQDPNLTEQSRILKEQNLRDAMAEQVRQQQYITQVSPLAEDMKAIIEIVNTGKVILKGKIKNARMDLKTLKAAYDTTKAGAEALTRMRKAMMGNLELNNAAEMSRMKVLKDITISIGTIRSGMETITELTSAQNLQDRARLSAAKKKLQALGIEGPATGQQILQAVPQSKTFHNIATMGDTQYKIPD